MSDELKRELREYFVRLRHRAKVRGGPDISAMAIADEAISRIDALLSAPAGEREGVMKPSPLKGPGGRQPIWHQPASPHPAPDNGVRVPDGWKLLKDSTHDERTFYEDSGDENGTYFNECSNCGRCFVGHKRRVTCKVCTAAAQSAKQRGGG